MMVEDRHRMVGKQGMPPPVPMKQTSLTNFFNKVADPLSPAGAAKSDGTETDTPSYGPASVRRVPRATIANSPSL
jgi:hypothetical protein